MRGVFPLIRPEGLNQRSDVVFEDCACNHTLTTSGLKLACSKGLGKSADDDGLKLFKVFGGAEGVKEGVVGLFDGAKIGDPSVPDQSLLLVGRGHVSDDAGSSRDKISIRG